MLAIEVELLTGTYTATHFNDREAPEWPPHPARLYSAMVNAWAEADDPDDREARALRWMESLGDPTITASPQTGDEHTNRVAERTGATHYVPVNDPAAVRDLHRTYERLTEAQTALDDAAATADDKAIAKAERNHDKALAKAAADSEKAASHGHAPGRALQVLPDQRGRQPRFYPTVRPAERLLTIAWPEAEPDPELIELVDGMLARIGRLGHSSSLVACRVVGGAPGATYVPRDDGESLIRLAGPGQFDRLCDLHASHQGRDPRQLPARMVRYGIAEEEGTDRARSVFGGDFIAAAITEGPRLSIKDSLPLARAVREAVLAQAATGPGEIPELISGHVPRSPDSNRTTEPSQRSHMAIVPLPFVGHHHADGLIKGIAIVVPSDVDPDDRQGLLRAIGLWLNNLDDRTHPGRNLFAGPFTHYPLRFERELGDRTPVTLRRSRWARAARQWATVTPLVLDRQPKGLWRGTPEKRARAEAETITSIATSCEHIGLPRPVAVEVRSDAPLTGAEPLSRHPRFRGGRDNRTQMSVHASITFDHLVRGPVILGRGRYLGQGLCLPVGPSHEEASTDD